jgi:uroporphyrinogen decarboxylase
MCVLTSYLCPSYRCVLPVVCAKQKVERPPVWMMRQAGRHMQVYRDLVKKYPTFRERSEIPEVSTEISLQPWNAYKTDGVILFSDILTPLPGMGVEFTIEERTGPKIKPVRTWEQVCEAVLSYASYPQCCVAVRS